MQVVERLDMREVLLEDKLRIQALREQKRSAKAIVVDYHVWTPC